MYNSEEISLLTIILYQRSLSLIGPVIVVVDSTRRSWIDQ